jgi:uncharacterized spore protein YtfJ
MSEPATTSLIQQQVDHSISGTSDTFVNRLADALGAKSSASAAYGPPIERDGVTVVPVAKVRWGFGGGGGTGSAVEKLGAGGSGGAGGTLVTPVGYIAIKEGSAEFRRIKEPVPPWMLPPILLAGTLAGFGTLLAYVVLHGLAPLLNRNSQGS